MRFIDITGQTFGEWTVLSYEGRKGWLCRCSCGTERLIDGFRLRNGLTKSCGCKAAETVSKSLFKSILGKKFGRLTVIEEIGSAKCKVLCDCGKEKIVPRHNLLVGHTQSCGCSRRKKQDWHIPKHGQIHTRLYSVWLNMRRRCTNPNYNSYQCYGGRGIKVCAEWDDFKNFYDWAYANGYSEEIRENGKNRLTLDRIDNDGNYEPTNCRWVDEKTQANNTSKNHIIEYKGKRYTLTQLCNELGLSIHCISWRLRNGWGVDEAIETPNGSNKWARRVAQ